MRRRWDIFCSVVDNFGDVGLCWRLARQLSSEMGQSVRLWVDDLASFHQLCHAVDSAQNLQWVDGVEIRHWSAQLPEIVLPEIVVEGFGARLPDTYVQAMGSQLPHPVWINLEYLSAESWVEECHGLPSPHTSLPLVKHFFFPGFSSATGGLLVEPGLARTRDAFQNDPAANAALWRALKLPSSHDELRISLFSYDNAALPELVKAWATHLPRIACICPEGQALTQLSSIAGRVVAVGDTVTLGHLTVSAIPFLEVDQYDRLLWACDFNFVRGEDSFVRAQLAARPLAWQAYPQADAAHLRKVSAFIERYASALSPMAHSVLRSAFEVWNGEPGDMGAQWAALRREWQPLAVHAKGWAESLAAGGNLAMKLAEFCENRLK